MQFVTDQTGISFNSFTTGIQRMTRRISEAAQGTGAAKNALLELGLSAESLNQLAPEDQFAVMADAINGLGNQADKVRIAMQLFDTEGVALVQTMEGGSEAINKMREEAKSLGLSLSRDQVDQMAEANDAVSKLGFAFKGAGNAMASQFALPIAEGVTVLTDALIPALSFVGNVLQRMGRFIGGFAAAVVALFTGDFSGAVTIAKESFKDLSDTTVRKATTATNAVNQLAKARDNAGVLSGDLSLPQNQGRGNIPTKTGDQKVQRDQLAEQAAQNKLLGDIKELLRTQKLQGAASFS